MTTQDQGKLEEIVITREFDAPRQRVWQAWTDPEMVKLWWGPEGFSAPSVKIDLKVGGMYIWAMQGPPGSPMDRLMYNSGVYKEIVTNEKLVVTQYMSDENGNPSAAPGFGGDPNAPTHMEFTVLFEETEKGETRLSIVYPKPESEAQLEAILKSGMKEGWLSSMNKLAGIL